MLILIFLTSAVLTGTLFYLLYRQGFAVTKSIAAVLFVFRPGKQADRVSLDSCTGWVRHASRFRQNGTYAFYLDCRLSKGNAEVALLDHEKRELLRLNEGRPAGKIELKGNTQYYLRWDFKNATGQCELRW
nr:hypothetical protein [uncultured Oscillibacter sp.]